MNVILLSGGSGKRLWPLSNDEHSKQFLKLFTWGDGYESMAQRVCRQLFSVDGEARVTVATSASQARAVRSQLGDRVSVCVEPCRRDTFPAVVLATAYLHDRLGVGREEAVVVCPVDAYVEKGYFQEFQTLQRLAEQGGANLTLMGIEPVYPSEKYGYMIPETGGRVSRVKEFHEKPDRETAKSYLARNALWNAGIFAFRLGYLLDKADALLGLRRYDELLERYAALEKISFDYAVVEKEQSIQALRYGGEWKDVGAWNTLTEVMPEPVVGKAVLDETCENTNVVNETGLPILCMGCRDLVVAASREGVLVADKERSGYIKPYVERLEKQSPGEFSAGETRALLDVRPGVETSRISLKAGERISRLAGGWKEIWTATAGCGRATVNGVERELRPGDTATLPAGCRYALEAVEPLELVAVRLSGDGPQERPTE